jgi:Fe-S oxidoreductase
MTNLAAVGNPSGEPREERADWAKGLGIKSPTAKTEYLYFPCCTSAYDPNVRRLALATASVLKKARINFGILGVEENCCGESARKAGEEELFQTLKNNNIEAFKKHGVSKIIVSSPHCYHSFKNEYDGDFEVIHVTQFLAELIETGKLKPEKPLVRKVAYHDPCYLGRHNQVFDEPRRVLQSIPELELVELPDCRENSLCCGGGGGRIWMETRKGERFSDLRLEQAVEAGAEVLAIACPYCMLNFDDSLLTTNREDMLEIRDIAELVSEAL